MNASRREKDRSEFRYGKFTRTVALPADADSDDVTAGCYNGILTVSIGLKNDERKPRRKVPVTKGGTAKG